MAKWFIALVSALVVFGGSASAGPLLVGAGKADITPDPKMLNWVGHKPYEGVLDPLYARAVVFSDQTNQTAILTWDLVDAREGAVARVRSLIEAELKIPGSNVLVNASHTHSGPWSPLLATNMLMHTRKTLVPVEEGPVYREWAEELFRKSVAAVRAAQANLRPASMAIGRANASDWLFNRRLRRPDGKAETIFEPTDPYALPGGLQFGPMDPTLTLLAFKDESRKTIATLFNLPCHSVTIYPHHKGISADWAGPVCAALNREFGGETLFLQGCAGDIVPARRGVKQRDDMAAFVAARAQAAAKQLFSTEVAGLRTKSASVGLPLTDPAAREFGQSFMAAEVQVMSFGPLAIVALPGEPLIDLALSIQKRSPFAHTVVLGYSNGYGIEYVGMTGEKARGGYEMSEYGAGADECGAILIEAASRLLREVHEAAATVPTPKK